MAGMCNLFCIICHRKVNKNKHQTTWKYSLNGNRSFHMWSFFQMRDYPGYKGRFLLCLSILFHSHWGPLWNKYHVAPHTLLCTYAKNSLIFGVVKWFWMSAFNNLSTSTGTNTVKSRILTHLTMNPNHKPPYSRDHWKSMSPV